MRAEWQDAGWGIRTVFFIAAAYWTAMLLLTVLSLPLARSAYEVFRDPGPGGSSSSAHCSAS